MPRDIVRKIIGLCINTIQLPHPFTQVPVRSLDQEVVMVAHQAIGISKSS
jgi:hypothetical protein